MGKRTKSSVKKSCDRLWSQLVKVRAGERCERCGAEVEGQAFHAHHVDGRNNHRLRFDPRNGVATCAACHRWAHDHPLKYAQWFHMRRPEDAAYVLDPRQAEPIHRNLRDYLALEAELRELSDRAT